MHQPVRHLPEVGILSLPLNHYQHYFQDRISHSSGLTKIALVVANIFTGLLAYPLFGALALLGIVLNARVHSDFGRNILRPQPLPIYPPVGHYLQGPRHLGVVVPVRNDLSNHHPVGRRQRDSFQPLPFTTEHHLVGRRF